MKRPLGELEMDVLHYVTDHAPITVREVAQQFGQERGLARTTILTVMENLRAKGYLIRRKDGRAFEYVPEAEKKDLLSGLVQRFVEKTLQGSVSPVVAYLANAGTLSEEEVAELSRLVDDLRAHSEGSHDG